MASSADVHGTVEGALLTLTLQFAQTTAGANLLLDQGVSDLLPQSAKWLLSATGGGINIHAAYLFGITQQAREHVLIAFRCCCLLRAFPPALQHWCCCILAVGCMCIM